MKRFNYSIAVILALGGAVMPAYAASFQPAQQPGLMIAANTISAKQAANAAQQQHGGRVLSVKLRKAASAHPYYAVKLIKNGKIRIVNIPAN